LKTPIAAMLATSETLENAITEDPESARRFAATLAAEARRLSALVQDLLDLARIEQPQSEGEVVDLAAIVEAELEACAPEGARVVRDLAPARVTGRASDLALLARNLLRNAFRYAENGTVTITVGANGTVARMVVEDTGVGIPEKDLPRVFERVFRVDQARARDTGGTGLGLAIVKHVAESHGGSVSVESKVGEGSRFTVELPLASETRD
jgi:signal transduction histidine kinase